MHPRRMCLDCQTITETPILTHAVERSSGPPWTAYACPDCAPRHLSTDEALRSLLEHTEHCDDCSPADSCARGHALSLVVGRTLRKARAEKSAS